MITKEEQKQIDELMAQETGRFARKVAFFAGNNGDTVKDFYRVYEMLDWREAHSKCNYDYYMKTEGEEWRKLEDVEIELMIQEAQLEDDADSFHANQMCHYFDSSC